MKPIRHFFFLFIIPLAGLLSCFGDGDESPSSNPSLAILNVEEFKLLAGEERRLNVDHIVAKRGIQIDGKLIFEYREGAAEDVMITTESGDIVINGEVIVEGPKEGGNQKSLVKQNRGSVIGLRGRNFIDYDPVGNLSFGPRSKIKAVDGPHGSDETILQLTASPFQGESGKEGGSIILRAPKGHIDFQHDAQTQQGPTLVLGNGGIGGDTTVDDRAFPNQGLPTYEIKAGNGGKSGELKLEAKEIRLTNATKPRLLLEGGVGGRGGSVRWDVGDNHEFMGLQNIVLRAGKGGDGRVIGGHGGHVRYFSDRVINGQGEKTTAVTAAGGDGGNIFDFPPHPDIKTHPGESLVLADRQTETAIAGDGGYAFVKGNQGRDGLSGADAPTSLARRHGEEAGFVKIRHGDGGFIIGASDNFPDDALAGHGGIPKRATAASELRGVFGFLGIALTDIAISTGRGGHGGDGCSAPDSNQRQGGNGGNGGQLAVESGAGGDGAIPGDGGNIYYDQLTMAPSGNSGNGSPPGSVGSPSQFAFTIRAEGKNIGNGKRGTPGQQVGTLPSSNSGNAGRDCQPPSPLPSPQPPPPPPPQCREELVHFPIGGFRYEKKNYSYRPQYPPGAVQGDPPSSFERIETRSVVMNCITIDVNGCQEVEVTDSSLPPARRTTRVPVTRALGGANDREILRLVGCWPERTAGQWWEQPSPGTVDRPTGQFFLRGTRTPGDPLDPGNVVYEETTCNNCGPMDDRCWRQKYDSACCIGVDVVDVVRGTTSRRWDLRGTWGDPRGECRGATP